MKGQDMFAKVKSILENPFWVLYVVLFLIYASAEKHAAIVLSIPRKAMLIVACCILLYKVITVPKMFMNKHTVIFAVFVCLNFITALIHRQYNLFDNVSSTLYIAVGGLLFLNQTYGKTRQQVDREMLHILKLNIYFPLLYAVIAVGMLIFNVSIILEENGAISAYGLYENRLWGLYNANRAGAICFISIMASLYLIWKYGRKKKFLYFNIGLQMFYLIMTQSRGSWIAFLGAAFLLIVFVFIGIDRMKTSSFKGRVRYLGITIGVMAILILMPKAIYRITPMIMVSSEEETEEEISFERIENFEEGNLESVSNGRVELWKAGLEVWKQHPILGVGMNNVHEYGQYFVSEKRAITMKGGLLHNLFLTALVSSGVVGFLVLMLFFVQLAVRCVKACFFQSDQCNNILCAWIAGLIAINLVENNLIYWNCIQAMVFWFVCSYFLYDTKKEK